MRVALRGPCVQVAKQPLHDIERHAAVDQKARERVTQIVQAHIREIGAFANAIPGKMQ